jgi:uncharacterized protein YlxP (DUF503 family)
MIYGALQIDFRIQDVHSLKEKRSIIQKLIAKIRAAYPISVSEVGDHDMLGNGVLGIAVAGSDPVQVEKVLQQVLKMIDENPELEVYDSVILVDQLK